MAALIGPDYVAKLNANLKTAKVEIKKEFLSLKEDLDREEKNILEQLKVMCKENTSSIKELLDCRTQTLASKATLSKTVSKSNLLQPCSHNLDSILENIDSQLENLTTINFSWNIPDNLWENLIRIDGKATNVRINKNVTKRDGIGRDLSWSCDGELSGNLKGMKVSKEKIYISDTEVNAIKIFTRNGEMLDSYTHNKLVKPGSMAIHKNYLYVLTSSNLFKISTIDLDTLSIVGLDSRSHTIEIYEGTIFIMSAKDDKFIIEYWNSHMLKNKHIMLSSPHIIAPSPNIAKTPFPLKPSVKPFSLKGFSYIQTKVTFNDMKIMNGVFYILFKNSIYPLQTFDLKGNLLNVILGEDFTHNLVGICVTPSTIILRDESNSQFLIMSNQGKLIRTIESEDTLYGLIAPKCMDIDERGNLVVCDGKDNWMLQNIPI